MSLCMRKFHPESLLKNPACLVIQRRGQSPGWRQLNWRSIVSVVLIGQAFISVTFSGKIAHPSVDRHKRFFLRQSGVR